MQKILTKSLLFKTKLALSFIFISLLTFLPVTSTKADIRTEVPEQVMEVYAKPLDSRAIILKDYLAKYNSPLVDQAQVFVEAADHYGVDWKLVPSIAGVESTFGKFTPGNYAYPSYNAWGWGVYGTQSLGFNSWRHGIFTVTEGLKKNYINKGLTDPYAMNRIYASSPTWGSKVTYFMGDLDSFAKNHPLAEKAPEPLTIQTQVAGASANLEKSLLAQSQ